MNWRNRKLRLGLVLALAVFAAVYAWRTSTPVHKDCVPGREEVKDSSGKVVEVKRKTCGKD